MLPLNGDNKAHVSLSGSTRAVRHILVRLYPGGPARSPETERPGGLTADGLNPDAGGGGALVIRDGDGKAAGAVLVSGDVGAGSVGDPADGLTCGFPQDLDRNADGC